MNLIDTFLAQAQLVVVVQPTIGESGGSVGKRVLKTNSPIASHAKNSHEEDLGVSYLNHLRRRGVSRQRLRDLQEAVPDLLNSLELSGVVVLHISLFRTAKFDSQLTEGVAVDGHGQLVDA